MPVNWDEINRALSPLKDFEDLGRRLKVSFAYPFVRENFNFTMPMLCDYTDRLLGGDVRDRYTDYLARLERIFQELERAGVPDLLDLSGQVESRLQLERFSQASGVPVPDTAAVLKYLVYWFIPMEKHLSGLARPEAETAGAIQALRGIGIRTNLDLLQQGITPAGRRAVAESSGLPEAILLEWVNRADLSRLPWSSKATIANLMGAGYGSLARLAGADPEKLYEDFFRYGKSIGKNLKLGNEIENSYRIAKLVPVLVVEEAS